MAIVAHMGSIYEAKILFSKSLDESRVIYISRALDVPDEPRHFVICDFGDA
jgi:hypothetical protein